VARYFISTAIPYVNDVPHIGHAYEAVNTDAVARWHRLLGDDVFFLTGTDEHGLKVQRSAEAAGLTPQEQVDRTSERFRETAKLLDISNDDFFRTTEPRHHVATQLLLQKIYDNGDIELRRYEGLYCVRCEAYYTDDELVDGNCPVHELPVEFFSEDNYFFKLSKYAQPLLDWFERTDAVLPAHRRNEALGLIRSGLHDVSITRTSIDWGVRVPWDEGHVFYVWYDALVNYITAIGYGTDDERFRSFWGNSNHVIGKDIVRFHCVYWPAMLLAAGLEPPTHVWIHGFLLIGGKKMSKTAFNQVAPADLVDDFGVDPVRYHLLREVPFGADGDFSYEGLTDRYNSDLANNLGNLLSRVATVVGSKCDGVGPAPSADSPLAAVAAEVYETTAAAWERVAPSEALEATWRLIRETNAYLEANEPWKAEAGSPEVARVLGDALESLRIVAILATPAIPTVTAEIWRRLGLSGTPEDQRLPDAAAWGGYPGGLAVEKAPPLFPRRSVD
jgi:methionyl-tRNA synthetase